MASAGVAGLAVLVLDVYSGIGARAGVRLSVHMLQHMIPVRRARINKERRLAFTSIELFIARKKANARPHLRGRVPAPARGQLAVASHEIP
jgi:hypothetical protein